MTWFIFAFLSAIFDATYFASVKKILNNVDKYVLASGIFLSSFIIMGTISIVKGVPNLGEGLIIAIVGGAFFNITATIFVYKALELADLSLAVPMMSFTPIFLIFTSLFLLNEIPTLWGILGITLIVIGSYLINISKGNKSLLDPLRNLIRNKGILYMLIAALLASFSASFDKMLVQNSDIFFGTSIDFFLLGIFFLFISFLKDGKDVIKIYHNNIHKFFIVGAILALVAIFMNIAFTMQIASYVISIKRLSILIAVIFGGLLFKEKNFTKRLLGAGIMVIGAILIILL